MENKLNARDLFYGIVAIATLIVAMIGATLAYFSITASSKEGAVNATAATVSINYNDGQQVSAQADELIPATLDVVKSAYTASRDLWDEDGTIEEGDKNVCIDLYDQQVCSIYRFSINSDLVRSVTAKLNNEHNEFNYLHYAVYDVTNETWLDLEGEGVQSRPLYTCDNTNKDKETGEPITTDDCYTITGTEKRYTNPTPGAVNTAVNSIFGISEVDGALAFTTKEIAAESQVYDVILFIKENDANQNADQGANFQGTIVVEILDSVDTGKITGSMD